MNRARRRVCAIIRVAVAAVLCTGCPRTEASRGSGSTIESGATEAGIAADPRATLVSPEGGADAGVTRPSVLLFGGGDDKGRDLLDTWTFDGTRWSQVAATTPKLTPDKFLPLAHRSSLTAVGGEMILLREAPQDVWTLDGDAWKPVTTTSPPPPPRVLWSSASLDGRIVIFGGETMNQGFRDTWTLDGATWTQSNVPAAPPAEIGAAMATLGDGVVLFGGNGDGGTWTFDGKAWTHVSAARSPTARIGAAMATLGDRIVLFGGDADAPHYLLQDTWLFDGRSWKAVAVSPAPPARAWASMATLGNEVALFGGTAELGRLLQDTWTFNGTRWKQVIGAKSPPARAYAALGTMPASP
jgi:hypothetical protein